MIAMHHGQALVPSLVHDRRVVGPVLLGFRHEARYNQPEHRIEMHLRSEVEQTVTIRRADFRFTLRAGETIRTESSHKFELTGLCTLARTCGFRSAAQWVDRDWPFAESLFVVE